jgi:hypothetical protein
MAFPFIFESNFETGLVTEWDSETTDTLGRLNVRHYTYLARYQVSNVGPIAPWRGAYCLEIDMGGETDAHQLIEGDLNIADTATAFARFYLFIGKDFTGTGDDIFNIFEQNSAAAVERAVSLRITAATNAVDIGVGKVAGTVWSAQPLTRGKWLCVELESTFQAGGTGTGKVYLDGALVAEIDTLTDIAGTTGSLGTKNAASTTSGHLFFDGFVADDLRIGCQVDRYPDVVWVTKTAHICVGDSELLNVTLMQGAGTDNVLSIFDTDRAYIGDEGNKVAKLYNLTASEPPIDLADVPVTVKRGAYVVLSGTSPQAMIHIGRSQGYRSHGRIRQHGVNASPHNLSQS